MSVLKEKRTVSKAEYVNTANQIYVETVGFLTRLSARYSRLIAEGTAQLAGEVMDHTEKANKIYPSDEQRKAQRNENRVYNTVKLAVEGGGAPCPAFEQEIFCALLGKRDDAEIHEYVVRRAVLRKIPAQQPAAEALEQECDKRRGNAVQHE